VTTDSAILRDSLTDPGRFAVLYDRHARHLYRFLAARLGPNAAEDVLSETYLVAFERRASFDLEVDDSRPWLFGIASRLVKKHHRLESRHLRADLPMEDALRDSTMDADEHLDAAREIHRMRDRLRALHTRDRDVLLLYAWADLDYAQIAAALQIPVGTVRSRLNRARRLLRTSPVNGDVDD
jgi:RNA polymerase sigma-70 factor (ECF subfamily)